FVMKGGHDGFNTLLAQAWHRSGTAQEDKDRFGQRDDQDKASYVAQDCLGCLNGFQGRQVVESFFQQPDMGCIRVVQISVGLRHPTLWQTPQPDHLVDASPTHKGVKTLLQCLNSNVSSERQLA